jgi:heat shock protein HslJ
MEDPMRDRSRRTTPTTIVLAALAALAAVGCGGEAAPVPAEAAGAWVLVAGEADGVPIDPAPSGATVDLVVEEDGDGTRVAGRAACNSYFAGVEVEDGALVVGPVGSTMMACEQGLMDLESLYLGALGRATAMTVDGDRLELTGPGILLSFTRAT